MLLAAEKNGQRRKQRSEQHKLRSNRTSKIKNNNTTITLSIEHKKTELKPSKKISQRAWTEGDEDGRESEVHWSTEDIGRRDSEQLD